MAKAKTITKELVDAHITNIPNLTDDEVHYNYKCASSGDSKLLKPYELALAKECKKRLKNPVTILTVDEVIAEQEKKDKEEEDRLKPQEY